MAAPFLSAPHPHPTHASYPERARVPADARSWDVPLPGYDPPRFEHGKLAEAAERGAADPADYAEVREAPQPLGGEPLVTDPRTGRPRNPRGRTGLAGRGVLYRWGPNKAADAVLTRTRGGSKALLADAGDFDVLLIRRGDNGRLALPGGMVDRGEEPRAAAVRELAEEAMSWVAADGRPLPASVLDACGGAAGDALAPIYAGTVGDPRDTDESWMETSAFHVHLTAAQERAIFSDLRAGDDAVGVAWVPCTDDALGGDRLHASHRSLVDLALERLARQ